MNEKREKWLSLLGRTREIPRKDMRAQRSLRTLAKPADEWPREDWRNKM